MIWSIGIMVTLAWAAGFAMFGNRYGPIIHVPLFFGLLALGYAALKRRPYSKVRPPQPPRDARSRA